MGKTRDTAEIVISGVIDDCAKEVMDQIVQLPRETPIALYIDSEGGSVSAAYAINKLLDLRCHPTDAYALGNCASAAFLVFIGCDHQWVTPLATFMFHSIGGVRPEEGESLKQQAEYAKYWLKMNKEFDDLVVRLIEVNYLDDVVQLYKTLVKEERWLTGQEVVAAGIGTLIK